MGYYQAYWHGFANPDRELRPRRPKVTPQPPLKRELKSSRFLGVYERKPWHDGLPVPGETGLQ